MPDKIAKAVYGKNFSGFYQAGHLVNNQLQRSSRKNNAVPLHKCVRP